MTKRVLILAIFCLSFTHMVNPVAGKELFNGDAFPIPCSTCTNNPGACGKSEPGNCPSCGTTSSLCCADGEPWTKYEASCRVTSVLGNCNWVWVKGPKICSIGHKCVPGEKGLRVGYCDCGYGAQPYYACCSGGVAVQCSQYAIQDGNYPPEGTCGGATQVACPSGNLDACCAAPTATPGPSPTSGGPTDTPPPQPCPYTCLQPGDHCAGNAHPEYVCNTGGTCCQYGTSCGSMGGSCRKSNPYWEYPGDWKSRLPLQSRPPPTW